MSAPGNRLRRRCVARLSAGLVQSPTDAWLNGDPSLTAARGQPRIAPRRRQGRGDVLLAPLSQRPTSVAEVTRRVILPALLDVALADPHPEAGG